MELQRVRRWLSACERMAAGADDRAPLPARGRLGLESGAGLRALFAGPRLAADGDHARRGVGREPRRRIARRDARRSARGAYALVGDAARARRGASSNAESSAVRPGRSRMRSREASLGHLKRFPDAHLGWLPFALAAARRQTYDVAYSSSGPFTSHVVGLLLKRFTRKPWVAELRDGWYRWNRAIFPDYPAWRDAARATPRSGRAFEAPTASCWSPIAWPTHFASSTPTCQRALRRRVERLRSQHSSTHGRSIEASRRLARPARRRAVLRPQPGRAFSTPCSVCKTDEPGFAREFRLTLLGTLDARAQTEVRRQRARLDHPASSRQTSHAAAIRAMRSADALLLVANTTPGAEATVPGKLFEYLAVGRPDSGNRSDRVVDCRRAAPNRRRLARRRHGSATRSRARSGRRIAERERRPTARRRLPGSTARQLAGDLARVFDECGGPVPRVGFDGRDLLRKRTGVVNNTLHLARELIGDAPVRGDRLRRPTRPVRDEAPPERRPPHAARRAARCLEAPRPATGPARATASTSSTRPPARCRCGRRAARWSPSTTCSPRSSRAGSRRAWPASCAPPSGARRTRPATSSPSRTAPAAIWSERFTGARVEDQRRLQRRRPRPLSAGRSGCRSHRAAFRRAATRSSCASAR